MIGRKTDLVRAQLSQEMRVILPPCGQRVKFDPTAPCMGADPHETSNAQLLEKTGFGADTGELAAGAPVFTGRIEAWERRVQILVPASPKIYFGIDLHPNELGPNRVYKLPVLAAGTPIKLRLFPDQWLIAATDVGLGLLSLIVEYHHMPEAR